VRVSAYDSTLRRLGSHDDQGNRPGTSDFCGRDGLRAVPFFSVLWARNDKSDGTEAVPPMKNGHWDLN
jgi:hypothetical protein